MLTSLAALRVLLVDDEPFQLKLLSRQLANQGLRAVTSGQQATLALDMLDSPGFDLIFCDLQMPGMDGLEFVRRLGERGWRGRLVLVSGEDARTLQTARRLAQAYALGVVAALQKPVTPDQLRGLFLADGMAPATPLPKSDREPVGQRHVDGCRYPDPAAAAAAPRGPGDRRLWYRSLVAGPVARHPVRRAED